MSNSKQNKSESHWPMPDKTSKEDGSPRQVGVEFELQGIEIDKLARLTALTLDGEVEPISSAEFLVQVPRQGDYRVEIDQALLKQFAKEQAEANEDEQSVIGAVALDALSASSTLVVPCEVVAPPLAMESFFEPLEVLTDAIRDAGGKGTRHSILYAFGVHLNVEPPRLESRTVAAYLKAFACLYDWLVWQEDVDWVRRTIPYIQRYPAEYDIHLTDPDYWPDWDTLIDDYLHWNATRNRALDMLPLFSEIDSDKIQKTVDDDRVKSRPAFHYRLANCAIDEPDWSIADSWCHWLQIEHLAGNRDDLNSCCAEYRSDRERLLHRVDNSWRESVTKWLRKL